MSDWLSALQTCSKSGGDAIPKGFKTRAQIQKEFGLRDARMREILRGLIESGVAEKQTFRVQTQDGIHHIPYYRIKSKSK